MCLRHFRKRMHTGFTSTSEESIVASRLSRSTMTTSEDEERSIASDRSQHIIPLNGPINESRARSSTHHKNTIRKTNRTKGAEAAEQRASHPSHRKRKFAPGPSDNNAQNRLSTLHTLRLAARRQYTVAEDTYLSSSRTKSRHHIYCNNSQQSHVQ